jgi:hypothetical protein
LAVAGKDFGLEIQTACGAQHFQEIFDLSCCLARVVRVVRHLHWRDSWFCFMA